MATSYYPSISIITVNYNGLRFLKDLFDSISNIDYPANKIQIVMVDNNSTDGSVEFVKSNFPEIEVLALDKNSGYAGGNNAGLKKASGRYIALINNDCVVDRNWLTAMVDIMDSSFYDGKTGAIGSKVVFFYKYLILDFSIKSKEKNNRDSSSSAYDIRLSGFEFEWHGIKSVEKELLEKSIKFIGGFNPCYGSGSSSKNDKYAYDLRSRAKLAVPLPESAGKVTVSFDADSPDGAKELSVSISGEEIFGSIFDSSQKKISFDLTEDQFHLKKDIINSCGTEINRAFYSRDRGFNDIDEGQFKTVEEIFSASGSSLLINRQLLDEIGFLNKDFFTYYEDIDFFWRARLKGWKVFFAPDSIARHYHCGTGKEWSYSFTYHVLRNRLLMIYRCGWPILFIRSYAGFLLAGVKNMVSFITGIVSGKKKSGMIVRIRSRIFFEFFYLLPKNFISRLKIRSSPSVSDNTIKSWIRKF